MRVWVALGGMSGELVSLRTARAVLSRRRVAACAAVLAELPVAAAVGSAP